MRRVLASGALLFVALASVALGAGPARAATQPGSELTSPANYAVITAVPFHAVGKVDSNDGGFITKSEAFLTASDGAGHQVGPVTQVYNTNSSHQTFDITLGINYNGPYQLLVRSYEHQCFAPVGCGGETAGDPPAAIIVNIEVPPAVPANFKAKRDNSMVTTTWDANTEPDMLGYILERATGNGPFECLKARPQQYGDQAPTTYGWADDLKNQPDADFRYRVRAIRAHDKASAVPTCADQGNGVSSDPSASSNILWRNPANTTTTTTAPGGTTTTTTKPKGPGAGSSSGSASSKPPPNLSALGSLGGANNLAAPPGSNVVGGATPDSGFNELLPFQPGAAQSPTADSPALPTEALPSSSKGDGGLSTKMFIAAGLLVTVLSMHVLWLKSQVDRMPLEPLAPEDLPLA